MSLRNPPFSDRLRALMAKRHLLPPTDAELCLAVHIGQLAVSGASGNGVGDWGPHLIVCPGVLLSAWRARLAAVCPGLRVHCVLAHSRGGTGRRLKLSIARRNVHICLTSYAALKLRPSRFEGVQWHLVILDQVSFHYSALNNFYLIYRLFINAWSDVILHFGLNSNSVPDRGSAILSLRVKLVGLSSRSSVVLLWISVPLVHPSASYFASEVAFIDFI
ncbi:unnamed protein product [Hydatigera taeniaeformis]|uniref:SNF2_N domain-containing protein n=1 Tax=Hydatigena taeniaeformis TaxID=6205 RepID=A0A0R3WUG3_HYDTA|nr:unnamed protein product [Hydatigera taeniaeformis]